MNYEPKYPQFSAMHKERPPRTESWSSTYGRSRKLAAMSQRARRRTRLAPKILMRSNLHTNLLAASSGLCQ
jgi:hypothetical protein